MIRKIIFIDEAKCNGCRKCVDACHEGALKIIDGKAKLIRDDYCDGLGDCLPTCPTGAISFIEREALPYDEESVKKHSGCPGSTLHTFNMQAEKPETSKTYSHLAQWPVQIKLVPINAPYFDNAKLLIAADCTAYSYGAFHHHFMEGHITIIGCPKLDNCDYSEKLSAIIKHNNIKTITVVRMEVPCCGGIEHYTRKALLDSGKSIPLSVITISIDGKVIN